MSESAGIELFEVNSTNVHVCDRFTRLEQISFVLCRRGSLTVTMDGKSHSITENWMYIYPAFAETLVEKASDDFDGLVATADFEFVLASINDFSLSENYVGIRSNPTIKLNEEELCRLNMLIELIRRRHRCDTQLTIPIISALVKAICYEIVDAYFFSHTIVHNKKTRKDKTFNDFLISLHKSCREHREVSYYADQQCLTSRYFSTVVNEKSGKSPTEWIAIFVIAEAKRLLSDPIISIKEISNILNFPSQSFFGRYFKQHVGISPIRYRRSALSSLSVKVSLPTS